MQINSRRRLAKYFEPPPASHGWLERIEERYREGTRFALACLQRSDQQWQFVAPAPQPNPQERFLTFDKDRSLLEKDLEEGLFWHGASVCLRTLTQTTSASDWYAALWGARSQAALTRALLIAPYDVQVALVSRGEFARDTSWRWGHAGAVAAARVVTTTQTMGVRIYEALPFEDARARIDALLVSPDNLPIALQIKSDRKSPSHSIRIVQGGGELEYEMRQGIAVLERETGVPWIPVLCTVGADVRLPQGIVGSVPPLRDLFQKFLQQERVNSLRAAS